MLRRLVHTEWQAQRNAFSRMVEIWRTQRFGRFAYHRQPEIGLWNLTRFAETLLPLLASPEEEAKECAEQALANFMPRFQASHAPEIRRKLGMRDAIDSNGQIAVALMQTMAE